jgi:UV DNA damage repair endonuclease
VQLNTVPSVLLLVMIVQSYEIRFLRLSSMLFSWAGPELDAAARFHRIMQTRRVVASCLHERSIARRMRPKDAIGLSQKPEQVLNGGTVHEARWGLGVVSGAAEGRLEG